MEPTVIILCGAPAVGKTTFARKACAVLDNVVHLNKDTVNEAFVKTGIGNILERYRLDGPVLTRDTEVYDKHVRFQSHLCLRNLALDMVNNGKCPVIDGTFIREIRNGMFGEVFLATFSGFRVKVVLCYAEETLVFDRMKQRNWVIDQEKMDDWKATLEKEPILPKEIENYEHMKLNLGNDFEECFAQFVAYVKG